ncbi:hypothetical protein CSUI_009584, partial [Cystoisospora suis]
VRKKERKALVSERVVRSIRRHTKRGR